MKRALLASVMAVSLAHAGCYATSTAYDGRLTFAYAAGADFQNFVKPIAPGAKLDIVAFANGTEDKLVVTKAVSSKPSVLRTEQKNDRTITLVGGEPGVAEIELTAKNAAGETVTDRMFFHVQKPAVHRIEHACTQREEAIYVRGDVADVYHALGTTDGRPVLGYDYAPLTIAPAGSLELLAQPQTAALYRYRLPATDARITVTSNVDQTKLAFDVVDRATLAKAHLVGAEEGRVFEGGIAYAFAQVASDRDVTVCSQNALTRAKSLTPDICTVSARLEDGTDDENHEQLAVISALKFGTCKYELTLPELAGGKGVRLEGKIAVGRYEFPGDGKVAKAAVSLPWLAGTAGWLVGLLLVAPNALVAGLLAWRRRRSRRGAGPEV